jgi:hypothetical protein
MSDGHAAERTLGTTQLPKSHRWHKMPVLGIAVGAIGIGASLGLAMMLPDTGMKQFFFSYLVAFLYFLSLALGGTLFVLIHYAAKAGWSVVVRRLSENVMGTLCIFAVLFIPIVIGMDTIFHHWTHPGADDPILAGKAGYLNSTFFIVRAVIYFAIWTFVSWWFLNKSVGQDTSGDQSVTRTMQKRSAPAIAAIAVSLSFASFDWIMSLDPHWYSTMFGVYYFAGCLVGIFSLLTLLGMALQRTGILEKEITTEHYHDLGKYMFAFLVFWSYIAFSQYMLIWYANIPEETLWIKHRTTGGWELVAYALMIGHFAIPFFFLLPRTIKRNRALLRLGAIWLLLMHFVDLYWLVMPTLHPELHPSLIDLTTMIGVGGFFFAAFGWLARKHAIIPTKDPRLQESLAFENF